jgi:hypothetical protein
MRTVQPTWHVYSLRHLASIVTLQMLLNRGYYNIFYVSSYT